MNNKHERAIMRMDCWDHTPCPPPLPINNYNTEN